MSSHRNPDNMNFDELQNYRPLGPAAKDDKRDYLIEGIIDVRFPSTGCEFFVMWRNYDFEDDSWQPLESFNESRELLVQTALGWLACTWPNEEETPLNKRKLVRSLIKWIDEFENNELFQELSSYLTDVNKELIAGYELDIKRLKQLIEQLEQEIDRPPQETRGIVNSKIKRRRDKIRREMKRSEMVRKEMKEMEKEKKRAEMERKKIQKKKKRQVSLKHKRR